MLGEVRARRREAAGDGGARSVQGRARLQIRGRARGGAHVEHVAYLSDFGGVEAQRLVEHRRALPRVERRGIRCVARGAAREAGGRRATPANAACRGGLDCRLGTGHGEERTANMPYIFVTLVVSKLSGWLNADADCRESKGGHTVRCEVRAWRREAAWRRATAVHAAWRGRLGCRLGAGHAEERTSNILAMSVTLEVSKLSGWLNADADCRE